MTVLLHICRCGDLWPITDSVCGSCGCRLVLTVPGRVAGWREGK